MAQPRRENQHDRSSPASEDWVDALIPVDLEWRTAVRRHPWLVLAAAAGVGYLLGSRRGARLLEDLVELASVGVTASLGAYLGTDLTDD